MKLFVDVSGKSHEVELPAGANTDKLDLDGRNISINSSWIRDNNAVSLIINGKTHIAEFDPVEEECKIQIDGLDFFVSVKDERSNTIRKIIGNGSSKKGSENNIKAPMPGLIVKLIASEGDRIEKGDGVIIIEAMKMENEIHAQTSGVIEKIMVEAGQVVDKGTLLISIKPE